MAEAAARAAPPCRWRRVRGACYVARDHRPTCLGAGLPPRGRAPTQQESCGHLPRLGRPQSEQWTCGSPGCSPSGSLQSWWARSP
eukprot:scaffold11353_cov62-Phaeocystis_antarctica.AAC.2